MPTYLPYVGTAVGVLQQRAATVRKLIGRISPPSSSRQLRMHDESRRSLSPPPCLHQYVSLNLGEEQHPTLPFTSPKWHTTVATRLTNRQHRATVRPRGYPCVVRARARAGRHTRAQRTRTFTWGEAHPLCPDVHPTYVVMHTTSDVGRRASSRLFV